MSISADVHPWGDISLLTAPPPTTSGVKSYSRIKNQEFISQNDPVHIFIIIDMA
jgi:hypothetical protein